MKRETRKLLRELVRLVEQDVTELRDAVAEVDERCAKLLLEVTILRTSNSQAHLYGVHTRDMLLEHLRRVEP